jgi:hypothetical protein
MVPERSRDRNWPGGCSGICRVLVRLRSRCCEQFSDGLHRMTVLPEDRFVDPSEDPDDVIARVAAHLSRADFLIRSAVTSLDEACTEIRELQTFP